MSISPECTLDARAFGSWQCYLATDIPNEGNPLRTPLHDSELILSALVALCFPLKLITVIHQIMRKIQTHKILRCLTLSKALNLSIKLPRADEIC